MGNLYKINPLVFIGVPTLQAEPISWQWSDAYASLQIPLGAAHTRERVGGELVATARNILAARALECNADWLLFISDDVIPPANVFDLLARHKKKLVTGVYWTKSFPKQPYIWRDILRGPFTDWKYGEFFKVDWAGCDCLLIHTDVLRAIEPPWFSHDWTFSENAPKLPLATEDLYFYTKTRQAGFDLWCDAACQCLHQDRGSKQMFGLDSTMVQHRDYVATVPKQEDKIYVADIGCGWFSPAFENAVLKRFDINPDAKPDVLCDIRAIPEQDETFDVVMANHVLEHFYFWEAPALVKEWSRILKVGGEIILRVPNLRWAAEQILKSYETGGEHDANYAFGSIYGTRIDVRTDAPDSTQIHRMGYVKHSLENLLKHVGCFDDIDVQEAGTDGEASLTARAKKSKSSKSLAILPIWHDILEKEKSKRALPENGHDTELAEVIHGEKEAVGC